MIAEPIISCSAHAAKRHPSILLIWAAYRSITKQLRDRWASPRRSFDARINELGDWRGPTLARIRKLIKKADPDAVEKWKRRRVPVPQHAGMILHCYRRNESTFKLTFARGASLDDPSGLFISGLERKYQVGHRHR